MIKIMPVAHLCLQKVQILTALCNAYDKGIIINLVAINSVGLTHWKHILKQVYLYNV